jgi:hypothetical protein
VTAGTNGHEVDEVILRVDGWYDVVEIRPPYRDEAAAVVRSGY